MASHFALLALPDAAFGRELRRRLGDHLGEVRPIGRRWSYPLSAMDVSRWTDTRLALVGDAAHGVHPIAGQGLNLGFRDVAALAEEVIAAWNAGGDPGAPAVRGWFRHHFARMPPRIDLALTVEGVQAVVCAVERGMGLGVVPAHTVARALAAGELVALTTRRRALGNRISMVRMLDRVPGRLERAFVAFVVKALARPPRP